MDAHAIARQHALGRVGFGTTMVLVPGLVARTWAGRGGAEPAARMLMMAVGGRDIGLGLGLVGALRRGGDASGWLRAAALADAMDLVATLRQRDAIPALSAVAVGTMAAASAVLALYLDRVLDQRAT
jgi:hypothetical protein